MFVVQKLRKNKEFLSKELIGKIHSRIHDSGTVGSDRVRDVSYVDRIQMFVIRRTLNENL